jgi:CTP:molybdopterin cytidylyltransferase MocA
MGSPKQILQFRGISLLRRAALAALDADCSPVIVVTGATPSCRNASWIGWMCEKC